LKGKEIGNKTENLHGKNGFADLKF